MIELHQMPAYTSTHNIFAGALADLHTRIITIVLISWTGANQRLELR